MNSDRDKEIGAFAGYDEEEDGSLTDTGRRKGVRYETDSYDTAELENDETQSEALDSLPPSDDPVKMYLKEIGQVPLLDSNREMWLSTQIAAEKSFGTPARRADEPGQQPLET